MGVDKELQFRMEIGETDTEGSPVTGRKHREEVVDGRAVSTSHTHTHRRRKHTFTHIVDTNGSDDKGYREK